MVLWGVHKSLTFTNATFNIYNDMMYVSKTFSGIIFIIKIIYYMEVYYGKSESCCNIYNGNGDVMKAELYPDVAPNTVNNFVSLVKKGFYDGLIFHRIIAGFMIQGGDPDGTGMGGPGYSIKGEFNYNGFDNSLKHSRGVLSMARAQHPDSAGSQFFIMHANAPHLDGQYAAFGKLIEGEDVLDKIASVDTDYSDRPRKPQVMKTVTVETFGVDYDEPETL